MEGWQRPSRRQLPRGRPAPAVHLTPELRVPGSTPEAGHRGDALSSAIGGGELDRQGLQATEEDAGPPPADLGAGGETQIREAAKQGADGGLPLQACQRCAKTVMDAVGEGQVLVVPAGDV